MAQAVGLVQWRPSVGELVMEFTALEQQLIQLRSELPPEKVPVALLDFRFFSFICEWEYDSNLHVSEKLNKNMN